MRVFMYDLLACLYFTAAETADVIAPQKIADTIRCDFKIGELQTRSMEQKGNGHSLQILGIEPQNPQ